MTRKERIRAVFDGLARGRAARRRSPNAYHRYVSRLVRHLVPEANGVLELGSGTGDVLGGLQPKRGVGIDLSEEMVRLAAARHPGLEFRHGDAETAELEERFDTVLMVNLIGLLDDVHAALARARRLLSPRGRLVIVYYSHLWEPILRLATALGLRAPVPRENWLPLAEVENLLRLTGYQAVRSGRRMLCPVFIPVLSWVLNRWVAPLPGFRRLCLIEYVVARPRPSPAAGGGSEWTCSIVIPTKDERGNIEGAVTRTADLGRHTELIFVDGNSRDGTVEEIHRMIREHPGRDIRFLPQGAGRGKADAVRKGFAAATGDVLMILDSDLTMPPEDLPKYFEALASGEAEFVNGCRLVYPMEKEAMRLLNKIANYAFGRLFSWLLEQRIRDTLCGTKVLFREDYLRIAAHRSYFGDFDPFGDFDLLFGAARLNLKIVDLPIRYRERTYGEIKIDRFRHGWLLVRMCVFGVRKLKLV